MLYWWTQSAKIATTIMPAVERGTTMRNRWCWRRRVLERFRPAFASTTKTRELHGVRMINCTNTLINDNLEKYYSPGKTAVIDEQLVPFRDRCSFKQYIPCDVNAYPVDIQWILSTQGSSVFSIHPVSYSTIAFYFTKNQKLHTAMMFHLFWKHLTNNTIQINGAYLLMDQWKAW